MASKADLITAGLKELRNPSQGDLDLVRAVAAMIALGPGRKKRTTDGPKLAVSPAAVYQAVLETGEVLCVPVDSRWFGRLGGVLKQMPDFSQDTLTAICAWLRAGGLRGWPQGKPTFSHFITHLDKWSARAVAWAGNGTGYSGADPVDWSMFR